MQNEETDTKNTVLVKFVLTVVSVLAKFEKIRSDEKYLYVQSKRSEDLWFDRLFFIPSLKKLKVQKFLEICLKEYIVRQHELIMFEKRDLRRCWFTKENDKYFFEAEVSPMWRPAKYKTLTNFLRDMNLIEEKENKLNLTGEGKNLYKTLKKGLFL